VECEEVFLLCIVQEIKLLYGGVLVWNGIETDIDPVVAYDTEVHSYPHKRSHRSDYYGYIWNKNTVRELHIVVVWHHSTLNLIVRSIN